MLESIQIIHVKSSHNIIDVLALLRYIGYENFPDMGKHPDENDQSKYVQYQLLPEFRDD